MSMREPAQKVGDLIPKEGASEMTGRGTIALAPPLALLPFKAPPDALSVVSPLLAGSITGPD